MTLPAFLLAFESSNLVWLGCKRHALPAVNARWSVARCLVLVAAQTLLGVALGWLISLLAAGQPRVWLMWLLGVFAACQSTVMLGLTALCWNQRVARLRENPNLPLGLTPFRFRLGRWALGLFYFVVLAGITPLVMLVTVENVYGQIAWRRECARLVAQGERLTFREILGPEIPVGQNAGAAPIFAPFFDYSPSDIPEAPRNAEGLHDVRLRGESSNAVARIKERLYLPENHLPKQPKGTPGSLKENLADWAAAYRELVAAPSMGDPSWAAELRLPAPGHAARDVLAGLAISDAVVAGICAASALPRARFPVHWDEGFSVLPSHLDVLKSAQINLKLRCAAHLAVGETDAAFADATNALNVAELLREEPLLISQMVRYANGALAISTLWQGLAEHRWTDAQLAVFQEWLGRIEYLPGFIRAVEGERACGIVCLDQLIAGTYFPGPENPEGGIIFRYAAFGVLRQNQAVLTRHYSDDLADLRATVANSPQTGFAAPIRARAANEEKKLEGMRMHFSPFTIMVRLIFPAVANAETKAARIQTAAQLAIVACALERHRLAHGSYPEALAALVPAYLSKPPVDPMTAQLFHYRRTDDGWFLLYSAGEDGKDDGGVGGVFRPKKGKDLGKDWSWPVPTRPEAG